MFNVKKLLIAGVAAAVTAVGSSAYAAGAGETEPCPDSGSYDRTFSLSFTETGNNCYYWNSGNDANDTTFQTKMVTDFGSEYGVIDKTEEGSLSSGILSGLNGYIDGESYPISFTIDLTGLRNAILVFKSSNNLNPAYAAFLIDDFDGIANGTFGMDPAKGLSHVTLYANVPLPASILMLIAALGGLALVGRRRETPAAA